jgi:toxin ParE1/3/4
MASNIIRTPRAREDLLEIWRYIAEDNDSAADRVLDRIENVLQMLSESPHAGRARPELARSMRSFPVGSYVLFYRPFVSGVELARVRNGSMDIQPEDLE